MVYKNAKLFMCILLNGKIPESYKRRAAMSEYILAVDIGTSNVKCMIARPDMTVLAEADSEYETLCTGAGRYEQDPELWWRHMILALQAAAAKASVRTGEIGRIAVSSQAPTMLPVDAAGRPLGNALIWMDRRSDAQCIDMGRRIGDGTVYRITGNKADPFYVYSELLWFKQNQPALYEKTRWILQANGSFTLDATHASITQCYDVLHRCWSSELLQPYGVPAELFPPVSQPVDVIGTVTQEAAAQTGLRAGTEVLAGSVDGAAAALEGGVTADGVAVEMSGTSSVLLVGSDRPHTSPNLTYMYSVVPEQHLLLGCMSTTGGVLKWYRDTFCDRADPAIYKKLDAQILAQCPEPNAPRSGIRTQRACLRGSPARRRRRRSSELPRRARPSHSWTTSPRPEPAARSCGRCARWAARSTAGSGCRSKRPSRECRSKFRRPATVRRAVCLPC